MKKKSLLNLISVVSSLKVFFYFLEAATHDTQHQIRGYRTLLWEGADGQFSPRKMIMEILLR